MQLGKLSVGKTMKHPEIANKQGDIIRHYDNSIPHVYLTVRNKFFGLREVKDLFNKRFVLGKIKVCSIDYHKRDSTKYCLYQSSHILFEKQLV